MPCIHFVALDRLVLWQQMPCIPYVGWHLGYSLALCCVITCTSASRRLFIIYSAVSAIMRKGVWIRRLVFASAYSRISNDYMPMYKIKSVGHGTQLNVFEISQPLHAASPGCMHVWLTLLCQYMCLGLQSFRLLFTHPITLQAIWNSWSTVKPLISVAP